MVIWELLPQLSLPMASKSPSAPLTMTKGHQPSDCGNVKSGEMDSELLGIGSAIDHVSFSADGTFVAAATNSLNAGGTSNHLIVWRLK